MKDCSVPAVQAMRFLVAMIFVAAGSVCAAAADELPCGRYDSDGGLYEAFIFGDDLEVTVETDLVVEKTTYIFQDGKIRLRNGIALEVVKPESLQGTDMATEGHSYNRKVKPDTSCSASAERLALESCYWKGYDLRKQGRLELAAESYLECCDRGDAPSCNAYGVLRQVAAGDKETARRYYTKACQMGYGGGCASLAASAARSGQREEARRLYQEACEKGHVDSCMKAAFEDF